MINRETKEDLGLIGKKIKLLEEQCEAQNNLTSLV